MSQIGEPLGVFPGRNDLQVGTDPEKAISRDLKQRSAGAQHDADEGSGVRDICQAFAGPVDLEDAIIVALTNKSWMKDG